MEDNLDILIPDEFYHIYNRANGNENIFLSVENHLYFMEKFKQYILPICDVYSYCLMPNHFHFLVRIKSEKELLVFFKIKDENDSNSSSDLTDFRTSESPQSSDLTGFRNLLCLHCFKN